MQVLHGAESDIVWLQQDFNLYIVNLFDTYHASKVLGMLSGPVRSLELNPQTRLPQARPRIFAGDVLRLHCGQAVFHVLVFAGVTIIFLPHCIAILSILPWERLTDRFAGRAPQSLATSSSAAA